MSALSLRELQEVSVAEIVTFHQQKSIKGAAIKIENLRGHLKPPKAIQRKE